MSADTTWGAGLRWAFGARAWLGFFASLSDGRILLRHELTWLHKTEEQAAEDILAARVTWKIQNLRGGIYANSDLWPEDEKDTGESRAETFARAGVILRRGSKNRVNNFARLRSWLAVKPRKTVAGNLLEPASSLLVHPDCKYFLKTLPVLVSSEIEVDDVATCEQEYPAFGASLYLMSRPLPSVAVQKPVPQPGTWGHALRHVWHPPRRRLGADNVRLR